MDTCESPIYVSKKKIGADIPTNQVVDRGITNQISIGTVLTLACAIATLGCFHLVLL